MTKLGSRKLHICLNVTKMGSMATYGHKIDYNGVRVCERPAAHTQQKLTQVPPAPPLGYSGKPLHYSVNRDFFNPVDSVIHPLNNREKDPVVRIPVGTNPALNFNLGVGFFFFLFINSTLSNNFLHSF